MLEEIYIVIGEHYGSYYDKKRNTFKECFLAENQTEVKLIEREVTDASECYAILETIAGKVRYKVPMDTFYVMYKIK